MLSFASPLAWQHHFEADGAVDRDDRFHLLHLFDSGARDFAALIAEFGITCIIADERASVALADERASVAVARIKTECP